MRIEFKFLVKMVKMTVEGFFTSMISAKKEASGGAIFYKHIVK